ncbi:nesprin-3 [Hippopotamus amphibius kiboko]|uniref:nesprin-3 n=1 Tax=Hippopotamus amphibius kiboko TaxID=575201 RepID=UPI002591F6C4|nr:nesprin-3 [Hippopotamus amphibius kiboko]XP_057588589.1 nesprin-3 [Hippopotamus amphibius kiboko]XP_057588590.1 nesprin-3 [Hippopotamus amphibius kiboko]
MSQQPREGFDRSVEDAREWMKAVQERLQVNDNTQGPRAALEARLRETEKICQLEPEGRVKVDMVLRAAEALLACCHEDQKPEILARLRDIKAQWEETVTYMTHCHSRIEWVWLHWSEYLLAQDEFYRWFQKMTVALEPPVELQAGLKEKQWQLSHTQVLLLNVDNQAVLLDRLLEEAASLFNRIGDPSVDEDAQKRMKAEYDAVKTKAQDRVDLLEQVTREHEHFQASVDEFQLWLKAVVERMHGCVGRKCQLSTQDRLSALQDIANDFPRGEESLKRLEQQAVGVIHNTSPLGAEKITKELEEMWDVLKKLRALWEEEEGRLQGLLKSSGACEQQKRQLEAELEEFRKSLQRLAEEGLELAAKEATEDELVARWRLYSAMRAALAAEEPRVDRLQARLKELIVFPQEPQPLADSVVAAIQEHQRLKVKSSRLCSAEGVELWQRFQRPLQNLQLWKALARRLLDVTASLSDLPSIHTFLPQIEAALAESSRLKEQLTMLQLKKDLLGSIFGQEKATALLEQVATSVRDRDLLHNRLLQRKSKLQSSLAQHKDFGEAFEPLQRRLSDLQIRVEAENGLQRDLPAKQAKLSRLQGLQEEGLDLGVQMEAMRPLIQGNPNHQHRMDQLSADHQALQRSLEDLVDECRQSVREHCTFSHKLLELRQWVSVLTQKLEAHRGDTGPSDAQSRKVEIERLLAEFSEKEAQLPLIKAHGQLVMEKSSPEGAAVVQEELEELMESCRALRLLEESLLSLIRNQQLQRTEVDSGKKMIFTNDIPKTGFLIIPTNLMSRHHRQANVLQEEEGSREDFSQLLRNFEHWLQVENSKLVRIIALRTATTKDLRTRETKLQELEARVPEGQHLFENLLRLQPARGSSDELEDLRYRWMLYKSKLKDFSHLLTPISPGEPTGFQKTQRGRGLGSLCRKVCCVALPLQLLLLLFLLLLFLLPVREEDRSCTLANNFAHSFRLMLRYDGPPPT